MASHHVPPDLNLWEWIGSVAGTVMSLAYSPPKTKIDLIGRVTVSILAGGIFAFVVGSTLGWPETAKHAFAAGAAVAFFSYALIGVVYRVLKGIDKWPPGK